MGRPSSTQDSPDSASIARPDPVDPVPDEPSGTGEAGACSPNGEDDGDGSENVSGTVGETGRFLAVPNRRAQLTGDELSELVAEANDHPEIDDVVRNRSNVTFVATSGAIADLRRVFGERLIIEPDRPLSPLGP